MAARALPEPVEPGAPREFRSAIAELRAAQVRAEIELTEVPAPHRLAPWTHAIAATVHDGDSDVEIGSGRLILLHDPAGVEAWLGTSRFVMFASCEVEGEIARDPLLPDVAWSWLLESLDNAGAGYAALSGTVTATSSVRFGDLAGTDRTDDVEIRASWTPLTAESEPHLTAFAALLSAAAGLPPEGISALSPVRPVTQT